MSEYQYYEFQAIERPLDQAARDALRRITSRGTITRTSLKNEYHFGDFKGDPEKLMEQYFDAHLYTANWGTRRLMFRLPRAALDLDAVQPYCDSESLDLHLTRTHAILDFRTESEGGEYDEFDFGGHDEGDEGDDRLAPFLAVRTELAAGDFRALYIGWLAGLFDRPEDDDELFEPPVPPGLGKLTAAQQSLAAFLRLDEPLLSVAADGSNGSVPTATDPAEIETWVRSLPVAEKDKFLVRVLQGDSSETIAGEIHQAYRASKPKTRGAVVSQGGRTIGELLAAREGRAVELDRREKARKAAEAERRARERAAAREKHLDSITGREAQLWREVDAAVVKKQSKEYDIALELLNDLRDLAQRTGTVAQVNDRVRRLRAEHATKHTFLKRLDRAGFPK